MASVCPTSSSVLALTGLLASMTVLSISAALPSFRADSALTALASQITLARELAVANRRNIEIRFVAPNSLQLHRWNGNASALISAVVLENNVVFTLLSGVPDTPDGFGRASAVDFGLGTTRLQFLADGTFVNQNLVPLNGTMFTGLLGRPETARAATVLGSTGRVRRIDGPGVNGDDAARFGLPQSNSSLRYTVGFYADRGVDRDGHHGRGADESRAGDGAWHDAHGELAGRSHCQGKGGFRHRERLYGARYTGS